MQMGGQAAVLAKDAMAAKEQVAALQERVRTATQLIIAEIGASGPEDLEEAIGRIVARLTQHTSELEAANHTASTHQALWREACDQRDKAQAELERVRAERDHAKKMEVVQKEVADNQTWHAQKLRTLIAANKETKHDAI